MYRWARIVGVTVVGTLVVFWGAVYPRSGAYHQAANMALAEAALPRVNEVLASNLRWKEVTAAVYTGQYGAVQLTGWVKSSDDLSRLMRAVAALRLSVPVSWMVRVESEE